MQIKWRTFQKWRTMPTQEQDAEKTIVEEETRKTILERSGYCYDAATCQT